MATPFDEYETVIGLECHVQLATASKLFSPARNRYGDAPNTNVDVVDAGLPGVLPVPNAKAIEFAIRLGLALGCEVRRESVFARKHYFYPDLPKGYQISQFELPICEGGEVPIRTEEGEKVVPLTRIHIEEDAGKNTHAEGAFSYVDYNRAGTPLLEVVSEPALRTPEDAAAYLRSLRQIVMYLGICDGNMQEGSLRADANVSVRKKGETALGQRTELKNLNSARFLAQAIEHEARRQILELEAGRRIIQETRLWDPDKKESRSMRTKEDAHDYRYFPDPDLLPLELDEEEIEAIKKGMPELPRAKAERFMKLGVTEYDAGLLTADKATADYYEAALAAWDNAKGVANWIINEVKRVAQEKKGDVEEADISAAGISPEAIGKLVRLIDEKVITGKIAKDVFAELAEGRGSDPEAIVEARGWKVERDEGKLVALVEKLIKGNPKQAEQYRAGKTKLLGFFVGQVMKETKGQADPADVNRVLKEKLDG